MVTGIGLLSGGLDSILAARLLMEQGITVVGISFVSPFFGAQGAISAAQDLGIELIVKDISEIHFEMVKNPSHGYGKHMNPCPDCHAMMVKLAGQEMERLGYDFIFTGEVLGQRPFSQNPKMLRMVADDSGYPDLLLRPLCARLMKATLVERDGRVNRDLLLDISGRARRRQIELAKRLGIKSYREPAGGCKLTETHFANRLREALADNPDMSVRDVEYLKVGRQFRLAPGIRMIIGKFEAENEAITNLAKEGDILLKVEELAGPTACIPKTNQPVSDEIAARIVARYLSPIPTTPVRIIVTVVGGESRQIEVAAFSPDEAEKYYIDPNNSGRKK